MMSSGRIVVLFFILLFSVISMAEEVNFYTNPQLKKEYEAICEEWHNAGNNPLLLQDVIEKFKEFGRENSENVYSAISLFNIAQIYHYSDPAKAKEYYKKALDKILENRSKWIGDNYDVTSENDATAAIEYGGLSAIRLAIFYFKDGDTTASINMIGTVIKEFPDAGFAPTIPTHFYHECHNVAHLHLLKKIPLIVEYYLKNYKGKYRKDYRKFAYVSALHLYLLLAEEDYIKIEECEALWNAFNQEYGGEIAEKDRTFLESWLRQLKIRQNRACQN